MFNIANKEHFTLSIDGLPDTGLQVLSFQGMEAISKPYYFEVTLVNKFTRFDITKLLSKAAYLSFTLDKKDGVHGHVMSVTRGAVGNDYAEYTITLAPHFVHLEKRTNQRIFQNLTVPQIISQILNEYGITEGLKHEFRLKDSYEPRVYCVQYDETDAFFIQRLCENEGIHFHFQHTINNHLMVFGDSNPVFPTITTPIRYTPYSGLVADYPVIKSFDVSLTSKTKRVTWRDYNFTNTKIPEGTSEGLQSSIANGAIEPETEFYAYPGGYENEARGKQLAQIQIERMRSQHILAKGHSDVTILHSGYYFMLNEHPSLDAKDPWLLNTIIHQGKQPQVVEALGGEFFAVLTNLFPEVDLLLPDGEFNQGYRNIFMATPKDVTWRPASNHPKQKIFGSQTAKIVGPAGEEVYCDEYGRVKAQFHWDREGKFNESSSCWIRVASNWAHKNYGAVTIPRIGMEVLITFLEGDPDQPVITGCIHNGINMLPYDLPANKTRTIFKTNSSKGGGGYNEIRIEDAKDQEEIYVQAQRDYNHLTKRNRTKTIGNDETNLIKRHRDTTVVGNHTEHVEKNQTIHIDKNQETTVDQYQTITVHKDQTETVNQNKYVTVKDDYDQTVKNDKTTNVAHNIKYIAGDTFEIVCGKSRFLMEKNGHVTITGSEFLFKTTGAQFVKAGGNIQLKAKKILEN